MIYFAITYGLGYFGFYMWFGLGYELAGFVAIASPITSYFVLRRIRKDVVKVNFKNISGKSILLGVGVPITYTAITVIIYLFL